MKLTYKISRMAQVLIASCCWYHAIIWMSFRLHRLILKDTMKDEEATLSFLYTCYGGTPRSTPYHYHAFEQSADEIIQPYAYSNWQQQVAWGTISPAYSNSWGGDDMNIWIPSYNWLGYVHHFLSLIDDLQPVGVTAEDKEEYKGECYFWRLIIISVCFRLSVLVLLFLRKWTRMLPVQTFPDAHTSTTV